MRLQPRNVKKIIIHCSETPDYDVGDKDFNKFGAKDIDKWHKKRGFDRIGYHYVIQRNGRVQKGRDDNMIGAHCYGENDDSIGICYIGTEKPTNMQIAAMYSVCCGIMHTYGLDFADIYSHNHFNGEKTCPGFPISKLLRAFWDFRTIPF